MNFAKRSGVYAAVAQVIWYCPDVAIAGDIKVSPKETSATVAPRGLHTADCRSYSTVPAVLGPIRGCPAEHVVRRGIGVVGQEQRPLRPIPQQ